MGKFGSGSARLWRILMDNVGRLRLARQPRQARPIALRAIETARKAFGPSDLRVAETLEISAELALELGDYNEARDQYLSVCSIFEEHNDLDGRARIAGTLGTICRALGDTERAAEFYRLSLDLNEQLYGGDFPELTTMANNLALIHLERGEHDLAESSYNRALDRCRLRNGENHPDVAMLLNNLGILYFNQDKLDLAEKMHLEAQRLRQGLQPPDPAALAQSASNLAAVYHAAGRLDEAEACYLSAISTIECSGAPATEDYLIAMQNYALLLRGSGDKRKARAVEDRVARLRAAAKR